MLNVYDIDGNAIASLKTSEKWTEILSTHMAGEYGFIALN
jgi:hypothetical protein